MPRPSSTSSSRLLSPSPLPAAYCELGVRGFLDKETSEFPDISCFYLVTICTLPSGLISGYEAGFMSFLWLTPLSSYSADRKTSRRGRALSSAF